MSWEILYYGSTTLQPLHFSGLLLQASLKWLRSRCVIHRGSNRDLCQRLSFHHRHVWKASTVVALPELDVKRRKLRAWRSQLQILPRLNAPILEPIQLLRWRKDRTRYPMDGIFKVDASHQHHCQGMVPRIVLLCLFQLHVAAGPHCVRVDRRCTDMFSASILIHPHLTFTDFVIKYLWSAAGYMLISIPVMLTRRRNIGVQTRSESAEKLDGATKTDNAVAKRTESESPCSIRTVHRRVPIITSRIRREPPPFDCHC